MTRAARADLTAVGVALAGVLLLRLGRHLRNRKAMLWL